MEKTKIEIIFKGRDGSLKLSFPLLFLNLIIN